MTNTNESINAAVAYENATQSPGADAHHTNGENDGGHIENNSAMIAQAVAPAGSHAPHGEHKSKKGKSYTYAYIFSRENTPALLNVLWVLIAYFGWFFTRGHLQVAANLLVKDGYFTAEFYGAINSSSYGVQFFSKFVSGLITDYFKRPKATFLIAAVLSLVCTVVNVWWFTGIGFGILYSMIKFLSAFGRVTLLKIIASWWPKEIMGSMGAIINISSGLGEVIARFATASLLQNMGWQRVWPILAVISGALLVPMFLLAKDRPSLEFQAVRPTFAQFGHMRQQRMQAPPAYDSSFGGSSIKNSSEEEEIVVVNPGSKIATTAQMPTAVVVSDAPGELEQIIRAEAAKKPFFSHVVMPLFRNPKFGVVLVLAFCSTGLRETITSWLSFYFENALGLAPQLAARMAPINYVALLPSSFLGGYLLDRVPKKRRGLVPIVFLSMALCAFAGLWAYTSYHLPDPKRSLAFEAKTSDTVFSVIIIMFASFSLSAPNSFLDGVYVVEMAGADGAAFAAGIVGAIGYCGAAISSFVFKSYTKTYNGWCFTLAIMCIAAALTLLGSVLYWRLDVSEINRKERRMAKFAADSKANSPPPFSGQHNQQFPHLQNAMDASQHAEMNETQQQHEQQQQQHMTTATTVDYAVQTPSGEIRIIPEHIAKEQHLDPSTIEQIRVRVPR